MNPKQNCLLQLVKEIDAFCKKHEITYYCAAGTVLGAIRHGGFIPWDDDIDILMTRSEFLRFVRAFEEDGPSDRTLEYYEADSEHHSTVARYIKESSTMFCHYHILGYASAGILIDIFVLDPVPDDLDAQHQRIAKFYAYSDLIAPTLCHSNRLPAEYEHIYDETMAAVSHDGLEAVAAKLADELFYMDVESNSYMLRWGSQPFIYPKEFFGKPEYLAFEDMMIPVPAKWPQYLVSHYSFGWTDIPQIDGRDHHVTIFDPERDYHEVYVLRDRLFDQDDLLQLHRELQEARRRADHIAHILEYYAVKYQSDMCMSEIRSLCANVDSGNAVPSEKSLSSLLKDLFASGQYWRIVSIFEPYLKLQTSPKYMGGRMHGRYYHWLFPLIIPVEDEVLNIVLLSLLYIGRLTDCDKLSGIYVRAGLDTECIASIRSVLDNIGIAAGLYYSGDFDGALSFIRNIDGYYSIPALKNYYWISLSAKGLTEDQAAELKVLASEKNASPEMRKAWADHLYNCGRVQEAGEAYAALMRVSRNGMFLKDIRAKGFDIDLETSETDTVQEKSSEVTISLTSNKRIGSFLRKAKAALARRLPGHKKRSIRSKAFKSIMGSDEDIRRHNGLPWDEYAEACEEVTILDRKVKESWKHLIDMAAQDYSNRLN